MSRTINANHATVATTREGQRYPLSIRKERREPPMSTLRRLLEVHIAMERHGRRIKDDRISLKARRLKMLTRLLMDLHGRVSRGTATGKQVAEWERLLARYEELTGGRPL